MTTTCPRKDQPVATATPLFFAQTDASYARCPACPACAAPFFAVALLSGTTCPSCEATYCCAPCQRRDRVAHGHWLLCGPAAKQFLAHARTTNDLFAAAARGVAALASKAVLESSPSSSTSFAVQLQKQLTQFDADFPADVPAWWEGAADDGDDNVDGDGGVSATLRDQAHESWTLLQLLLRHGATHVRVTHHPAADIVVVAEAGPGTVPAGAAAADLLTWGRYGRLVGAADAHLAPLLLEHPLAAVARGLPGLPRYRDRVALLRGLARYLPAVGATAADLALLHHPPDTQPQQQHQRTFGDIPAAAISPAPSEPFSSSSAEEARAVRLERLMVRLAQAAALPCLPAAPTPSDARTATAGRQPPPLPADNPFNSDAYEAMALVAGLGVVHPPVDPAPSLPSASGVYLRHSCVPNTQLEAHRVPTGPDGVPEPCLVARLIATRDHRPGEALTASAIVHAEQPLRARRAQLTQRYGPAAGQCPCPRCVYDTDPAAAAAVLLPVRALRALAEQAMQEGGAALPRAVALYAAAAHRAEGGDVAAAVAGDAARGMGAAGSTGEEDALLLTEAEKGDLYHALGAALLDCPSSASGAPSSLTRWPDAHRVWALGAARYPTHPALRDQARKVAAYTEHTPSVHHHHTAAPSVDVAYHSASAEPSSGTGSLRVHLSRQPVLAPEECATAVRWAEEHAAASGGGWTTSRHHAVPTTDLPVHAVGPLLRWFNARMGDALAPALATQYGRGDGGRVRVAVHDAFIVKYHHDEPAPSDGDGDGDRDDGEEEGAEAFEMACVRHFPALFPRPAAAGGTAGTVAAGAAPPRGPSQRHLPLHTDQSTHSLTIALNAFATTTTTATINDAAPAPPPAAAPLLPLLPERYRGGGTYVAAWGCAVRPPAGHVLSFPGSLLHGGDPLLGGTRYIIAAFLLLEQLGAGQDEAVKVAGDGLIARLLREHLPLSSSSGGEERGEARGAKRPRLVDTGSSSGGGSGFSFGFDLAE